MSDVSDGGPAARGASLAPVSLRRHSDFRPTTASDDLAVSTFTQSADRSGHMPVSIGYSEDAEQVEREMHSAAGPTQLSVDRPPMAPPRPQLQQLPRLTSDDSSLNLGAHPPGAGAEHSGMYPTASMQHHSSQMMSTFQSGYPTLRSGVDIGSFRLPNLLQRATDVANVPDDPFWAMPHAFPLDLTKPEDCRYVEIGLGALQDALRFFARKPWVLAQDPLYRVRAALLLLHMNRFINALEGAPDALRLQVKAPATNEQEDDVGPAPGSDPGVSVSVDPSSLQPGRRLAVRERMRYHTNDYDDAEGAARTQNSVGSGRAASLERARSLRRFREAWLASGSARPDPPSATAADGQEPSAARESRKSQHVGVHNLDSIKGAADALSKECYADLADLREVSVDPAPERGPLRWLRAAIPHPKNAWRVRVALATVVVVSLVIGIVALIAFTSESASRRLGCGAPESLLDRVETVWTAILVVLLMYLPAVALIFFMHTQLVRVSRLSSANEAAFFQFTRDVVAAGSGATMVDVVPVPATRNTAQAPPENVGATSVRVDPPADQDARNITSPTTDQTSPVNASQRQNASFTGGLVIPSPVFGGSSEDVNQQQSPSVRGNSSFPRPTVNGSAGSFSDSVPSDDEVVSRLVTSDVLGHLRRLALVPITAEDVAHFGGPYAGVDAGGTLPVPWTAIEESMVVIGVTLLAPNSSLLRIVCWNSAAVAATGLQRRRRLEEAVEETTDLEPIAKLLHESPPGTVGETIEMRFHNSFQLSTTMHMIPVVSQIACPQVSRSASVKTVVLVGHGNRENTLVQSITQYKQTLLQLFMSQLQRDTAIEPERKARYRPLLDFLRTALSWEQISKTANAMQRWQRYGEASLRSALSASDRSIILVTKDLPATLYLDRVLVAALKRALSIVHANSESSLPIQIQAHIVDGPGVVKTIRFVFSPTGDQEIAAALEDATLEKLVKDGALGIEAYNAHQQMAADVVPAREVTAKASNQLAIVGPCCRTAPHGDVEDDEDMLENMMSVNIPKPAFGLGNVVASGPLRLTAILVFPTDQITLQLLMGKLTSYNATEATIAVDRATNVKALEKKLDVDMPVHVIIMQENLDGAEAYQEAAFRSRWGETVIVAVAENETQKARLLEEIHPVDPDTSAAAGGFFSWGTNHDDLGAPYELKQGDEESHATVHRLYRLVLPVAERPVRQLIGHVTTIEHHRIHVDRLAKQQKQALGRMVQFTFSRMRMLGSGALGTVWEAHVNDQRYAMKESQYTPEEEQNMDTMSTHARCLNEDKALNALIGKPYVIRLDRRVHDEEACKVQWFMEYCERQLPDVLPYENCAPVTSEYKVEVLIKRMKIIANVLLQLTTALNAVHAAGWVHHDVKPENVMIKTVQQNESQKYPWEVRLLDFSEAAPADVPHRHSGGTPAFVSPEKLENMNGTFVDIFALGVVAMELSGWAPPEWMEVRHKLGGNQGQAQMVNLAKELKTCFEEHTKTAKQPRMKSAGQLRSMLFQFITACIEPDYVQRPQAAGLLQYQLLRWITLERDSGGTLMGLSGLETTASADKPARDGSARGPAFVSGGSLESGTTNNSSIDLSPMSSRIRSDHVSSGGAAQSSSARGSGRKGAGPRRTEQPPRQAAPAEDDDDAGGWSSPEEDDS